ncbi:MAG: tyrosine-type recombinase/integrase [Oscillospiraceae bacterium]|nr:tyrosine-type recombinase/integrase [Oscillospiraceae bacterium]
MPDIYTKTLRELSEDFIAHKRAGGFKAKKEAQIILRFVKLAESYDPLPTMVTKDIAEAWENLSPNESPPNQRLRIGTVRRFAEYLNARGMISYVYPYRRSAETEFKPYIFTNEELARFFTACDNTLSPYLKTRCEIASLLFRMLYATGMRLSEATHLTARDVDLIQGVIRVNDTKFNKERLLPVDDALLARMKRYSQNVLTFVGQDSPFFPNPQKEFYSSGNIYSLFRDRLWAARISHGGKGAGPRVHDLRHTFAVHCLRRAVRNGEDLSVMLKYLSVYMGHCDISSTQAYLRLTADMYPDIVCLTEHNFDVLPDLEVLHEAN